MASMYDALDETLQEPQSKLKIIIFTLPVFAALFYYKAGKMDLYNIYLIPTVIVLLGSLARVTNNTMQSRDLRLPSWNIFTLIFDTIRTLIALTPALLINGYAAYYLITKVFTLISVEWIAQAATYITYGVCGAIIVTVFMLYSKRFKFTDIFDLSAISDSCIDVLIQSIWMAVQLVIIDLIIFGTMTYLFYVFIDKTLTNWMVLYVWAMGVVFDTILAGNYLGQLNYEALHQKETKQQQKQQKKELEEAKKEAKKAAEEEYE